MPLSFEFQLARSLGNRHVCLPDFSIPVFHPPTTGRLELVFTLKEGEVHNEVACAKVVALSWGGMGFTCLFWSFGVL